MARTIAEKIDRFLAEGPYAVVGASTQRTKYGNRVLRAYLQHDMEVYPVNPNAERVEGLPAYASLGLVPRRPRAISFITQPHVTEQVVREAVELGCESVWMQPGAESAEAVRLAEEGGMDVIADGSCLLVVLGYREGTAPS